MTSLDELSIVSTPSWTMPMKNPAPTTCIAMSLPIPNSEQAMGMSSIDPPVAPDARRAARLELRGEVDEVHHLRVGE